MKVSNADRRQFMLGATALGFVGSVPPASAQDLPSNAAIDAQAKRLMASEDVKGMALAVIDGGQIRHVAAFGARNVERQLPLQTDTVMYGASLTKTAFAYFILRLVDEGRIDLDKPLADYLPKPLPEYPDYGDLKDDDRWRTLTARIVLNNATGFANFRFLEDDGKLRFHWQPGSRYGYSAEGFYILQLALEEGLKLDVGAEMNRRLWQPFGMTRTSMTWRADFAQNLADGYALDSKFEPHDERSSTSAAGSMDTTIADQAQLWSAIMRGQGVSKSSRTQLVRPQRSIISARQFPTLRDWTDPRGPAMDLSAGLGLVTFRDASGPMWFKGGHNDWTGNMVVGQEAGGRAVVLLANSVRAELIYPQIIEFILGRTAMPWWWEYGQR